MSNNQKEEEKFRIRDIFKEEKNVRYALILFIGLFGGWLACSVYSAIVIYPHIGSGPSGPSGNGNGNGDTTTTTTTTPISGHFEFVTYTDPPNTGKTLIHGGVGTYPITEIYFRMQIHETQGIAGTCYVDCKVQTTNGKTYGGVGSVMIGAGQTLDHSFVFTIDSADYDYLDWSTATIAIVSE